MTYLEVMRDYRVILMIFQYGMCFGSQLVMHNVLHTHFHDYFHVEPTTAGFLAFGYGGMNLWARSSGGILSDWMSVRWGMQGRLWAHFISLFVGAIFLFLFGYMDKDIGWHGALPVLMLFSQFCNMAEGTTYGIVPFMIPKHMAVVSAVVGAGGTLGALLLTMGFYRTSHDDELTPFRWHGIAFMVSALSVIPIRWDYGSMWSRTTSSGPQEVPKLEADAAKLVVSESKENTAENKENTTENKPVESAENKGNTGENKENTDNVETV